MKIICAECSTLLAIWNKKNWTEQDIEDAKQMFRCSCCPDAGPESIILE